ncbi:hypothetical protein Tco_0715927, partial [Tanacetum coccineum]
MSDSEDSTVTYTEAPPSLDYVPGPEYPPLLVYVPYVPEPVYPEFMPLEDDVLPAEDQPLPADVSPTADSPGYITESDPEEDPNEEESYRDDVNDEEEDEDEDKEEEKGEHLAPVDSVPPPTCRTTARMFIQDQTPIPFPPVAEVDRFLAISTPPPSPLTSYSSPLPHIPSPPLPVSSPLPVSPLPLPVSPTYPLGYRAAMIRLRAESPSTSHPLPLPSPIGRCFRGYVTALKEVVYCLGLRFEVGESSSAPTARPTRGFRADYGYVGTLDDEIRRDPEREVGYGITDTWDEMVEDMLGTPATTDVAGLSQRMTDFVMTVRQDTDKIYGRLDDAQDDRLSRKAWVRSMDASDTARSAVRALRTTVLAQQTKIGELRAADRKRQTQLTEALTLLRTLHTHMVVLQSQQTPVREPTRPEIPEEAGSIIFSYDLKKMAPKRTTRSTPATTTTLIISVTDEQLKRLIDQGVADALAVHDADKNRNGEDSHDSSTGVRRQAPLARGCTYPDFMKCKPLYFKGTEGVVELTQWFERMETTVGHDVAYAITWTNLKKKMTDKYCPRGEVKKLEGEMWNLKVKESDKIEKYVGGLLDMIHRSVMASKPKTMQDAIQFATELMDQKIRTFLERQSENKRKQDDNQHQQQNKRQNTGRDYAAGSGEKKPYGGSKPLCSKCNYHHDGQCAPKCNKCIRVCDCRSAANSNTANNQRGTGAGDVLTDVISEVLFDSATNSGNLPGLGKHWVGKGVFYSAPPHCDNLLTSNQKEKSDGT